MLNVSNKKSGFTLIELLIVVAIIGILASIVLVSTGGARKSALAARALSDLNQLMLAEEVYHNENDKYYAEVADPCTDASLAKGATEGSELCYDSPALDPTLPRIPYPGGGTYQYLVGPLGLSETTYSFKAVGFEDGGVFICKIGTCYCDTADKCRK